METIALRFADHFAPDKGTIYCHREIIESDGSVWYGKLGSKISEKMATEILNSEMPRILLIHSGATKRYWAYISEVKYEVPQEGRYPNYYGEKVDKMKTWFRINKIEDAPTNVISMCVVTSSGAPLSDASKHSMSPYFKITVKEV